MRNILDPSCSREVKPGDILRRRGVLVLVLWEWDDGCWLICPVKPWAEKLSGVVAELATDKGKFAALPVIAGTQWKEVVSLWEHVATADEGSTENAYGVWRWTVSGGNMPTVVDGNPVHTPEDWDMVSVLLCGQDEDPDPGVEPEDLRRKCRGCPVWRLSFKEDGESWNPLTGYSRGEPDCAAILHEEAFSQFSNKTCIRGCLAGIWRMTHLKPTPFQEKRLKEMETNPPKKGKETVHSFYCAQFFHLPEEEGPVPGREKKSFKGEPEPRDPSVKYADEVIGGESELGARLASGWDNVDDRVGWERG